MESRFCTVDCGSGELSGASGPHVTRVRAHTRVARAANRALAVQPLPHERACMHAHGEQFQSLGRCASVQLGPRGCGAVVCVASQACGCPEHADPLPCVASHSHSCLELLQRTLGATVADTWSYCSGHLEGGMEGGVRGRDPEHGPGMGRHACTACMSHKAAAPPAPYTRQCCARAVVGPGGDRRAGQTIMGVHSCCCRERWAGAIAAERRGAHPSRLGTSRFRHPDTTPDPRLVVWAASRTSPAGTARNESRLWQST